MKNILITLLVVAGIAARAETFPVKNGLPGSTVTISASDLNGSVTNIPGATVLAATNAINSVNATNLVGYTLKTNVIIYLDATTNLATNTVIYPGK